MKLVQMADAVRYARMTSAELRETFLLEGMFNPGKIEYAYVDLDRTGDRFGRADRRGADAGDAAGVARGLLS